MEPFDLFSHNLFKSPGNDGLSKKVIQDLRIIQVLRQLLLGEYSNPFRQVGG